MDCRHKILLKNGNIVPCGKCPACLANQRQEWVFRLKQEYLASVFSVFVTITYDDQNCPSDLSVNKKDVQDFHKRLRKHFPSGDLRFYLVSEYGDRTFRPHYHGLYFFKSKYEKAFIYDVFEKAWNKGFLKFGDVEEGSIVYCTKYCLKHKIVPPGRKDTFRLMSRMNGGLGSYYLDKMSDYHEKTNNDLYVVADGKVCRMPRYYKSKLATYHDQYQRFDSSYDRMSDDFNKRFKAFLRDRHYPTFKEAVEAFQEQDRKGFEARDQLILKHTKKQSF